ncbi:uncharacterized protein LOC132192825 [Neocloeon triangulifer]|uniref:uncharacterized protein LOC132192825 n=1 Tax=Neocloeon triangulifer TaxID=2078957 RepID=UPI00286F8733|nr:uncharacterized protein LOC132192825 [Neocloeon triangulifer]XP_059468975.1 uncharacterized protein LOC132192825 [Neocloeon triangulifer]
MSLRTPALILLVLLSAFAFGSRVTQEKLPRDQLFKYELECSAPAVERATLFSECVPYNEQKSWPSHWARCKCAKCVNNLSTVLLCGQDGMWYRHPDETKPPCDDCEKCLTFIIREGYDCPEKWEKGDTNQCTCKHDCLTYEVTCTCNLFWSYSMRKTTTGFADCNSRSKTILLDKDEIQRYVFRDGIATVECKDGYKIEGAENVFDCKEGKLNGTLPRCIKL